MTPAQARGRARTWQSAADDTGDSNGKRIIAQVIANRWNDIASQLAEVEDYVRAYHRGGLAGELTPTDGGEGDEG